MSPPQRLDPSPLPAPDRIGSMRGRSADHTVPNPSPMSTARPRWASLHFGLLALAALIIAGAILRTTVQVANDRQRTVDAAYHDAEKLAESLAEHAAATVELAGGLALIVSDYVAQTGGPDTTPRAALAEFLRRQLLGARAVASIVVTDAQTRVIAHSYTPGTPLRPVLDQPHYRFHLDDPTFRGVRIGAPFRSSLSGTWLLPISTALFDERDRMVGIVCVSLALQYFETFYAAVSPDEGSVLGLLSDSGMLLARAPAFDSAIGKVVPGAAGLSERPRGKPAGRWEGAAPLDQRVRLYIYLKTDRYPLVAVVGNDLERTLAPWAARARQAWLTTTLACLLCAGLVALLSAQARRLERTEERFLLAAKGAAVGVWSRDLRNGDFYVSPEWLASLGYAPGEVSQSCTALARLIHPDDHAVLRTADATLMTERRAQAVEFRMLCKDGSYRWFAVNAQIVAEQNGTPVRLAGSLVDIHQRKCAEDAVREANDELEARVRDRTARLAAANRELARANNELESFSYSVSHDLRAPVRHIGAYAQLLRDTLGPSLGNEASDYFARLDRAVERMDGLIHDLLALSRMSRQQMELVDLDLSQMARAACNALHEAHPECTVELLIHPHLRARGDPGLVRAVLDNLLGNAWKFTRNTVPARIEVGRQCCERGEAFFVRDNGAGFDMRYAAKLFHPFQRLHSEREFEGTGIGLATVRRVVERHNGAVWASSQLNRGTTLYFTLPEPGDKPSVADIPAAADTRRAA